MSQSADHAAIISRLAPVYQPSPIAGKWNQILDAHPRKIDLNRKWLPKQKTIQNFNIDAQGLKKTRNENPPTWEIGVTS